MNLLILVVDDEPDVELLFRQHFRRDLRERRFTLEFAQSGDMALPVVTMSAYDNVRVGMGETLARRPLLIEPSAFT